MPGKMKGELSIFYNKMYQDCNITEVI